jgi:predicted ATPase
VLGGNKVDRFRSVPPASFGEGVGACPARVHLHADKTQPQPTLALQVARARLDRFTDGGWLAELAEIGDPAQVPAAVAGVLGLKFSAAPISVEAIARAMGNAQLLLLLDNCEHLVEVVAELAEAIVHFCPQAQRLMTSRETLRIDGEHVFRVMPLGVPPAAVTGPEAAETYSAVALFVARLQALDAGFVAEPDALRVIGEICRRLDGVPLAIEFAASRAAALGVAEVALGLEDRFGMFTSGRRTAIVRHRTLRAMLDWSYNLLLPDEAEVLRRLSVFAGWFNFEAAVAVGSCDDLGRGRAVEALANLVAKSLAERGDDAGAAWHHAEFFHDTLETIGASGAGEAGGKIHHRRRPDRQRTRGAAMELLGAW